MRFGRGLASVGVLFGFAGLAAACTPPKIAGEPLNGTSTGDAFGGVQCSAVRPQTEPDLMAWDPASRSNLNRLRRAGVVAVRYEAKGCNVELELLSNCIAQGPAYSFSPYSANEHKLARNANELFAQLPVGAARLSGSLKGNRVLRTDYMLAGQYALPPGTMLRASDLRGDCARATHAVSAVYVGAFAMGAGESRVMEGGLSLLGAGGGLKSSAAVESLGDEGSAEACKVSQDQAQENERCAVPLRIGLIPLEPRAEPSPAPPPGVRADTPPSPAPPPAGTPPYVAPPPTPSGPGPARGEPFNRVALVISLNSIDVSGCKRPDGPSGEGHVTLTFEPNGTVSSVRIDGGAFPGTAVGGCLAAKYRDARVPPFVGNSIPIGKSFKL